MTGRITLPTRPLAVCLTVLAAATLSLLGGLAFMRLLAAGHPGALAGVPSPARVHEGLAALPAAAVGPVSGALGASNHAYLIRRAGGRLRALNPAQDMSSRFDRTGVTLGAGSAEVGIGLAGLGYGNRLSAVAAATPSAAANRVTYEHPGLSEWYANGPLGLEQGFTLRRPPPLPAHGPLTLSLRISGASHMSLANSSQSVTFHRGGGAAPLRYGGLRATGADGRELRSWLELRPGGLLLRIDTRGARYPLSIDPLVQQAGKLTGGEEVGGGYFGFSVAMSADGNTALIGGPGDDNGAGAVWVFVRSGGEWAQQGTKLLSSEAGGGEQECVEAPGEEETDGCSLGRSVALSADGNTALIGGPAKRGPCSSGECALQGAAWVFTREGSTWTARATLTGGTEEAAEGRFGRSVALSADGGTAAIGAPGDQGGAGAVWMFAGSGSSWSQQGPKLTGQAEFGLGRMGRSVALSADGSAVLAGGPADNGFAGAAWLFTHSGSTWQTQKLVGGGDEQGDGHFGSSVALSADAATALVGARSDNSGAGAVWAFTRFEGALVPQGSKLTAGEEESGAGEFGTSVAISADGDAGLIGAPRDSVGTGAAWLFTRSGGVWQKEAPKLTAPAGEASRRGLFGTGLALRPNAVSALIGAPMDGDRAGAVWSFTDPSALPAVSSLSPRAGPAGGGTTVQLTGSRFTGATAVNFDSTPATSFTVNSDGSITAVSPPSPSPGAETVAHVTVVTAKGVSPAGPADQFRYSQAPKVASVSPAEGSSAGGTSVTITGSHFTEASAVSFGTLGASSYEVTSPTSITAVSPAESPGTVHVTVTTPGGTSSGTARDLFTFASAPLAGPSTGGSAGVLGFGPTGSCAASLVSRSIKVLSHSRAAVRLIWRGAGSCRGKLRLGVKVRSGKRVLTKTIGTGTFVLVPRKARSVTVTLNSSGRALLKRGHGRLRASLLIDTLPQRRGAAKTATVQLALQAPRKAKLLGR